jgi:phosphoglycolate phosphatase-like HAD superfamily hydrolase
MERKRKSPERIVLFDIDGTLLYAGRAPARSILRAIEEVFGIPDIAPPRGEYSFAGRTDPEIVTDLLVRKGIPRTEVDARLAEVFERYILYLKSGLPDDDGARLHEGVLPLLTRLDAEDSVMTGLLTGNIEEGARIKLDRLGIAGYFAVGAYGSDSADRDLLPRILLDRVARRTGRVYGAGEVVVVGDTARDIRCARTICAKTIAVATGTTTAAELRAEDPDFLFDNLGDTDHVMQAIMS